jgi:hypothetical protein
MEVYNKHDVLSLEELYLKLAPWHHQLDFNLYTDSEEVHCRCGCTKFEKRGYAYTASGKYQRYLCKKCGAWTRGKDNLLTREKRKSLRPEAC